MKKRLLSISLALLGCLGASAAYESGGYYYNEAGRWIINGDNLLTNNLSDGLAAFGFKHTNTADLGEAIADTFEVVTSDGMPAIQVNKQGGEGTGGELFLSQYLNDAGVYVVTYKVKGAGKARQLSQNTASGYNTNYQHIFLNDDGTTTCDATEETGNGGVSLARNLRYGDTWKEMSYTFTVSDPKFLNLRFFNLLVGDMIADFGIYKISEVGDDRVIKEYKEIINGYLANETDFPNERESLQELLGALDEIPLEEPLDASSLEEADAMISDFLDANTVDVSGYFSNWDFSGGNSGEAKGIKNWTVAGGHTGRWGVATRYARGVDYGEGKYIAMQAYPQGMSDGSTSADLYQTVALPAGRYMFTCKSSGNYHYRVSGSNKYGVVVCDSVTGMGMYVNSDTLWFNTVKTVSPTKANRYSMIGTVAEGESMTLGYHTPGMIAKTGGTYSYSPVEIRLLGGKTQADVDAFFYEAKVKTNAEALKVMVDSANNVLKDDQYFYCKDSLTIVAAHGQQVYDEYQTVYTNESADTLSKEMVAVRNGIRLLYSMNSAYTQLSGIIAEAETLYADENRPAAKGDLGTAIDAAKAVVGGLILGLKPTEADSASLADQITALPIAIEAYYIANASYNTPGKLNVINPNFANSGTGWNVVNSGDSKEVWKYGSDATFTNGTKIYAYRGTTTAPANAVYQTVALANNGHYEIAFEAYAFGQKRNGTITDPIGVYFVKQLGGADGVLDTGDDAAKIDSVIVHTDSLNNAVKYKVAFTVTNAPVNFTFGLDALSNTGDDFDAVKGNFANGYGYGGNELTFYGDYDTYKADSVAAVIKPTRDSLQAVINAANALKAEVRNPNNVDTAPFQNAISEAQGVVDNSAATLDEINAQFPKMTAATNAFMISGVYPAEGKYFNLTPLIKNPKFKEGDDNFDGWEYGTFDIGETPMASDTLYNSSGTGLLWKYFGGDTHDYANLKGHSKLTQTVAGLPAGNYIYSANMTYRNVTKSTYSIDTSIETDYTSEVCWIIANDEKTAATGLLQVEGAKVEGTGDNSKYVLPGGESFDNYAYIHTVGVADFFAAGYYRSNLGFTLAEKADVALGFLIDGLRVVGQAFYYNPELRFYGDGDITGIENVNAAGESGKFVPGAVYTLTGTQVRANATSLKNLGKGVYIMNGKKFVVK